MVRVVGSWLEPSSQTEITRSLLSSLLGPNTQPSLSSALVSCLEVLVTSPLLTSPAQLALPLLSRLVNTPSLSAQARQALQGLSLMMDPARLSLHTDNTRTSQLQTLPDSDQIREETQLSSASTQTSGPESLPAESDGAALKIVQERINQME